jgi:hypothetical protein
MPENNMNTEKKIARLIIASAFHNQLSLTYPNVELALLFYSGTRE